MRRPREGICTQRHWGLGRRQQSAENMLAQKPALPQVPATAFLRLKERVAFGLSTIAEQREYTDALVFRSPALAHVQVERESFAR
jgi:hypothetical protein